MAGHNVAVPFFHALQESGKLTIGIGSRNRLLHGIPPLRIVVIITTFERSIKRRACQPIANRKLPSKTNHTSPDSGHSENSCKPTFLIAMAFPWRPF
jgi:hypothetical protein